MVCVPIHVVCPRALYNDRMAGTPTDWTTPQSVAPRPFRFRLVHLIYAVTLLATSLATFGAAGLMPGILFNVFWAIVYNSRSRPKGLLTAFLVVILGCGCIGLLLPAFSSAREAARRMQCLNNLKQIALALHNYHDVYGVFPPAYIPDAQGKPKHSWRVLILPFLEEQGTYEKYDFDEPWDGPNNRALLTSMPRATPVHPTPGTPGRPRRSRITWRLSAPLQPGQARSARN